MASVTDPKKSEFAGIADFEPQDGALITRQTAIYVYEAPLRFWHWVNALCILVLALTGYFIGQPPIAISGEASNHQYFGLIRWGHFVAGQILAVAFLMRIYWAFMGNHHARQMFYLPVWSKRWWSEVLFEAKWYAFIEKLPKKYVGHNPLAQLAMVTLFTIPLFFMIITGFALYSEGQGKGGFFDTLFGWVIPLAGNPMWLHTMHRLGMWVIVCFAIVHIYAAIREDIMSRQSMLSTMMSGWRMYKDDKE